jgi:thiol-disulfide isomerase/thioredoxin
MKNFLPGLLIVIGAAACNSKPDNGFTITGSIANAPDQKLYLEELYFNRKNPEVLDTAELKSGRFKLSAKAPGEGLYRLRMEKDEPVFFFINDTKEIALSADAKNISDKTLQFNSAASNSLKNFVWESDRQKKLLAGKGQKLQKLFEAKQMGDSLFGVLEKEYSDGASRYQTMVLAYIDTVKSPIGALFAMGFTRGMAKEKVEKALAGVGNRFTGNETVASVLADFKKSIEAAKQREQALQTKPTIGSQAPDLVMETPEGKNMSISSLKGKYVLVDFWASWCGPCRSENPNLVEAYNKYKDKNFTILGVSLDKNKNAWTSAITTDQLSWYHMSDLKQWSSDAVMKYGIDGIPYNVLIDPNGKIVAEGLRGEELHQQLQALLK